MTKKTMKTKMKNQSLQRFDLLKKIAEHFKSEDEEVVKESLSAILEASKKDDEEDEDEEEMDEIY